tara:strand:- start:12949 stop:14895 length:1947 start_codon:yes stop_codon:yes gene_type:complete
MLEKQQHILALDDLFEDEEIGAFVRSIQIDSPYQQLIFEGVLTETIKEERVMVTFTVEGYFHYVLGEVIEKQTLAKGPEALKELLENNNLRGITEGIEQCLVRDVEKNDLSRLMWLIDEGGKALDTSAYPLAQAFTLSEGNPKTDEEKEEASKNQIEKVMEELLAVPSDNDIEVLEKAIEKLESAQQNEKVKIIFKIIYSVVKPNNILKANLFVKSISYIPKEQRKKELDKISSFTVNEENEIAGDFYFSIAKQFEFIADYNKAIEYSEKSLKLNVKLNFNDSNLIAKSHNILGFLYKTIGNNEKANLYYKKSLSSIQKKHGNEHPYIAKSLNGLGYIFLNSGDTNKALNYFEKSLNIFLKVYGEQHPLTADGFTNLGILWFNKKNINKSLKYHEKSLEINLKVFDKFNPSVGTNYLNLGVIWNHVGNTEKAIYFSKKSLEIDIKTRGEEHPWTADSYNILGKIFIEHGNFSKALFYLEKALNIVLNIQGRNLSLKETKYINLGDELLICDIYHNIGNAWIRKCDLDKALKYFEKSYEINFTVNGDKHTSTAFSYNYLGIIWRKKGDYNKAINLHEKALAVRLKVHGNQHPDTSKSYENLGDCYNGKKQYSKAKKYYQKSYDIFLTKLGKEHKHTKKVSKKLKEIDDQ